MDFFFCSIPINKYTFRAEDITSLLGHGFDNYAKTFLSSHLDGYFAYVLMNSYGVPAAYATGFAPYFRYAAMAHFAGDELKPESGYAQFSNLNAVDPSGSLSLDLGSLWTDINTPDNNVTINMEIGTVK